MREHKLILGTVQFGLDYGINNKKGKPSNTEIEEILDCAYNNNITILDTAEAYGDSQEKIGGYHSKHKNKFKVITKYSSSRYDLPENVIERIKKNIKTLNIESLYSYMFHSFNDFNSYFGLFKESLENLKENGFIKKIGVSLHSNEEIDIVLNVREIDLIQLPFNLLDNSKQREEILLKAKSKGVEVHTRSVFLQGLFFKELDELSGNLLNLKDELKKIKSLVPKEKMNYLALNYVCSKHYIDGVLLGVDNVNQLKDNIEMLKDGRIKNDVPLNRIDEIRVKEKSMLNPVNW